MDNIKRWLSGEQRRKFVINTTTNRINVGKNNHINQLNVKGEIRSYPANLLLPLLIIFTNACNQSLALNSPSDPPSPLALNPDTDPSKEVDLCEACRLVVNSFDKGLEETARGKHEGGDTSWEERNLKSYQDSEVRLIEIQERLCEDIKGAGKAQCLSLAEDTESEVEEWWFKQRNKNVRLFDYLCISKLKRCCPSGSFGPNCQPCTVDCSKHGVCDGSGTRTGTGECNCNSGYIGSQCDGCADDHFRIATSDDFTCLKCDPACKGCYGPGQTNCTNCREGYYKHEVDGCIDVNECDLGMKEDSLNYLCQGNKYCINTDGSYRCADCHVSCSGCVAYGSDWCIKCAPGYQKDDNEQCRTIEEIERLKDWNDVNADYGKNTMARYFFYVGVLAVSVMMFRSNIYVMYTFTLGFIVVMIVSEFNLMNEDVNFTTTKSSQD